MLDGANSTKFLTCWVSLKSSHANFQNIFVSPNIADILNFRIFAKHKNAYILKTMLDRADCTDFGCHNSIRLETKHFLNTLALTFISFSGRFVFYMQKHYLFFCERSSSYILGKIQIIIIIIVYLYSAQYLHIQQDSKCYLTHPNCTGTAPTHR